MSPLFKRNDKTTIAELEEYYANQKKRRSGMAWVMAFISLLITITIIVLLFLGGRWVYRTFIADDTPAGDDNETALVEGTNDDVDLPNFDSDETGADRGVSFEEGSSNNPDDLVVNDAELDPASRTGGTVSEEAASTSIPNTDRLASNNDSSVASDTDTNQQEIPNTGTGEELLFTLFALVIVGYLVSNRYYANK